MRHSDHIERLEKLVDATKGVDYRGVSLGLAMKIPFQDFLRADLAGGGEIRNRFRFVGRGLASTAVRVVRGLRLAKPPEMPRFTRTSQPATMGIADFSGHPTNMMLDIVREIPGESLLLATANPSVARAFAKDGRAVLDLSHYLFSYSPRDIRSAARAFAQLDMAISSVGLAFRVHAFIRLITILKAIDYYSNSLRDSGLRCLTTTCDTHWHEFVATAVANQFGIFTATHQHGEFTDPIDYTPVTSRSIFVWGKRSADFLAKSGVPKEKIRISGNPQFDRVFEDILPIRARLRAEFCARYEFPEGRKTLLYLSSGIYSTAELNEENALRLYRCFSEVAKHDLNLIVKLHPHQDTLSTYEDWSQRLGLEGRVRLFQADSLFDLLAASDAAVTYHSTTGIEAIGFGLPVFTLNVLPGLDVKNYVSFVADTLECRSAGEFVARVSEWLESEQAFEAETRSAETARAFYFGNAEGPAAARVFADAVRDHEPAAPRCRHRTESR